MSWGLDPWGTGKPMVTLVTFRPCLTMSVEDAVLRGLLSSSGFNEIAYEREMKVFTGAAERPKVTPIVNQIPFSDFDEHGLPKNRRRRLQPRSTYSADRGETFSRCLAILGSTKSND